jgi:hypothetical protein
MKIRDSWSALVQSKARAYPGVARAIFPSRLIFSTRSERSAERASVAHGNSRLFGGGQSGRRCPGYRA